MLRGLFCCLIFVEAVFANSDLDSGDYWFKNRAVNSHDDRADSLIADKIINAYKQALKDSSVEEISAEKLLYTYYFKGCYAIFDKQERMKIHTEAKDFGERMHAKYPNNPTIASLYAQNISLWAREYGPFQAVKEGIAVKVRDLADSAKNYQILGREHQLLPYIPLLLNWPDKELADKYLTLAHEQDSSDINTMLFLAELRLDQQRYDEALNFVNEALAKGIRPDFVVEDKRTRWKLKDLKKIILKKTKSGQ